MAHGDAGAPTAPERMIRSRPTLRCLPRRSTRCCASELRAIAMRERRQALAQSGRRSHTPAVECHADAAASSTERSGRAAGATIPPMTLQHDLIQTRETVRGDMIWRVRSLPNRWLDAIGNQLRVWPLPDRSWSFTAQVVAVGAAFLLSCWLTITSVSYFGSHQLLSEAHERIRALQQASAELSDRSQTAVQRLPRADRTTWRRGPRNSRRRSPS